MDSKQPLTEIRAAIRYSLRVPAPKETDLHLDVSVDEGKTWTRISKADLPKDNEFSSGWMYGKMKVAKKGLKSALIRVHFYAGGYTTGIIDAQMYGVCQTAKPSKTQITYGWKEQGKLKKHTETIAAQQETHRFTVPTKQDISNEFIRLEVK